MNRTVLITGATGFVGSYLALNFLKKGYTVIALVRPTKKSDSMERLKHAITEVEPGGEVSFNKLITFEGEVQTFETSRFTQMFPQAVDEIWHCSASFKFKEKDIEEIKSVNVDGTKNLLELAVAVDKIKPLTFFYVSTAYSCGIEKDNVEESFFRHKNEFRSYYEWSKHEAEAIVAEYNVKHGINSYIFRPSIIIGGLTTNKISHAAYYQVFSSIIQIINRMKAEGNDPLAINVMGDPGVKLNMVTIDFVIAAMLKIASSATLKKSRQLKTFNITNEAPPSLHTINKSFSDSTGYLGIQFVANHISMSPLERLLSKTIAFQLPYMNDAVNFQTSRFREIVPEIDLPAVEMNVNFLNAVNANFLRLTNTVMA